MSVCTCVSSEREIPEARQSKGAEAIIKQIIEEKCIDFKRLEASEQKGLYKYLKRPTKGSPGKISEKKCTSMW